MADLDPKKSNDEKLKEFYPEVKNSLNDITQAFEAIDTNGDGLITPDEFKKLLTDSGGVDTEMVENLKSLMMSEAMEGDGKVDFKEFLDRMKGTMKKISAEQIAELREAFNDIDGNNDGVVTIDELRTLLGGLEGGMTDEEIDEIFKDTDTNGDGKVDFEEFCKARLAEMD